MEQLDYPSFRISVIAKSIDRFTIRYLNRRGEVTYAEWRVLARLATLPEGGTVGQVADLAWVDRAEVSRAATALEAKGYTSRRENEQDRRTPIMSVTDAGNALYTSILRDRISFHEALLSSFSTDERVLLDDFLSRIGQGILELIDNDRAG